MPPTLPPELLIAVGGMRGKAHHHPSSTHRNVHPFPRIQARESASHLALFGRFKVTFDMVFLVS